MRDERLDDLRTRLIGAAEGMIAESGLPSVRARDLATAAGCSVGQIYNVFPDLDALVLEANRRTLGRLAAALTDAAGSNSCDDQAETAVRLAMAYLAFASAHRGRWRALFEHRMGSGAPLPEWYATARAAMFEILETPLSSLRPDLSPEECGRLARTVFSAAHGIVDLGLTAKLDDSALVSLAEQLRIVIAATIRGLSAGHLDHGKAGSGKT